MLVKQLCLEKFKIAPCDLQGPHNHKQCIYYHGPKDRRREGNFYQSDMCEFAENGENGLNCPLQDSCMLSHNKVESLYQHDKYKKKFCTLYPGRVNECEYGDYCSFAHDETEIQIELIHNLEYDHDFYIFHYKTVWCPFNYINHDRANCVYAHNWQDFRRKPNSYEFLSYEPVSCPFWKPTQIVLKYDNACPNQYQCMNCHGWKELEYHPKIFKIRKCSMGNHCTKGGQCPYYHSVEDQRFQSVTHF